MRDKSFKPANGPHHERLLASGQVVSVEMHAPRVFRHVESGDTYAVDDDGRLITGYLPLRLGTVPRYQIRETGLQRFASDLEEAAGRILGVLGSPLAVITAAHVGVNLAPAKLLASALTEEDDKRKALRLLDLYGSEKVAAWSRAILELGGES